MRLAVNSLLDVADLVRGVSYKRDEAQTTPGPGNVPILRANNIRDGRLVFDDLVYVPAGRVSEVQRLRQGDIIIAMSSGSRDVVGKAALVTSEWDCAFGVFCGVLRAKKGTQTKWLAHFLQSPAYRAAIDSVATGTNINNLSKTTLSSVQVPVMTGDEQASTIRILDGISEHKSSGASHLLGARRAVERFRQAVLAAACSGRLTASWHGDAAVGPAIESLRKRTAERDRLGRRHQEPSLPRESAPPDIPDRWCWASLAELGELGRGKSKHRPRNDSRLYGGNFPFVQTGDIARSDGRIRNHSQTYNEQGLSQSRLWPERTVCITIAANIAESALLTYPACFPDSVVGLVADESVALPEYVELFIRTAKRDLAAFAPATAQANINLAILSDLAVPLPPLHEQTEIIRRVGRILSLAADVSSRIDAASQRADRSSQAVLAKAFRGEFDQIVARSNEVLE